MARRSYLTPAGATGESTLSKRNALLGSNSGSNESNLNLSDPYGYSDNAGSASYSNGGYGNISRSASPYGRPASSNSQYASHRTAEDLESQNEEELEGLGAKVKILKDITINIGKEVRDQTGLLGTMNDSFENAGSFLSGTFKRMNRMSERQGGRWWYWLLFLILVFWIFVFRWLGII